MNTTFIRGREHQSVITRGTEVDLQDTFGRNIHHALRRSPKSLGSYVDRPEWAAGTAYSGAELAGRAEEINLAECGLPDRHDMENLRYRALSAASAAGSRAASRLNGFQLKKFLFSRCRPPLPAVPKTDCATIP